MRVLAGVALAAVGAQASTLPTALTSEKAIRDATVNKCYEKLAAMLSLNTSAAVSSNALKAAFKKIGLGERTDGAEGDHKYPGACAASSAGVAASTADSSDLDDKVTTSILGDSTKAGTCCLMSPPYTTSSYGDSTAASKADMLAIFGGVATSATNSEKGGTMALGLNTVGGSGIPTPNVPAKGTLTSNTYASYQTTAVGGCAAVQQAGLPSIDSYATGSLTATVTTQASASVDYGLVEGFKLRDHDASGTASKTTLFIRQGSTASTITGDSSKACTLAKVKTIKSAMHGSCEAAFAQNWGAATSPAKAALATSFAFSNVHVGDIAGQFYSAAVGSGYPDTITTNRCATSAHNAGVSIADATANAVAQNSECEQAVIDVFRANGGFSSGTTALTSTTVMQGSTTALSDVGSGNEWYGRYDKAVYDGTVNKAAEYTANFNNYLMPKKFANAGSTFFQITHPTITFDSTMDAAKCKAWIDTVDAGSTIAAQTATDVGGGDTTKKVVTLVDDSAGAFAGAADAKVQDRIKAGTKIIGLKNDANNTKFHAKAAATGIGSEGTSTDMAGILKAECELGTDGGLIVTYDTAVRAEDKVPQFALASGKVKSTDGSAGTTDCPAAMRTALKVVMAEHCFVGSHLVNPKDARGYYAAFQFNLGQLTKLPPKTDSDVAGVTAVTAANLAKLIQKSGILPQALAACGYFDPVTPGDNHVPANCTHKNDNQTKLAATHSDCTTKPTSSGAWSRFGAVVATAALAALAF